MNVTLRACLAVTALMAVCAQSTTTEEHWQDVLLEASSNGLIHDVHKAVASGSGVDDVVDELGRTALFRAAMHGHVNVLDYLESREADVNAPDDAGDAALLVVARRGDVEMTKALVNRGATVSFTNEQTGETALTAAISGQHIDVVDFLLSKGAPCSDATVEAMRATDLCHRRAGRRYTHTRKACGHASGATPAKWRPEEEPEDASALHAETRRMEEYHAAKQAKSQARQLELQKAEAEEQQKRLKELKEEEEEKKAKQQQREQQLQQQQQQQQKVAPVVEDAKEVKTPKKQSDLERPAVDVTAPQEVTGETGESAEEAADEADETTEVPKEAEEEQDQGREEEEDSKQSESQTPGADPEVPPVVAAAAAAEPVAKQEVGNSV